MARRKKSEAREATRFAVILTGLLLAVSAFSWYRDHPRRAVGLLVAAGIVLLIGLALRPLWLRFFRLWMKLAEGLSWVMTRVLLSVFFYGILTPVGLVMRLLGKAPMDLAWKDGRETYWIDRSETEATLERYEKQF